VKSWLALLPSLYWFGTIDGIDGVDGIVTAVDGIDA